MRPEKHTSSGEGGGIFQALFGLKRKIEKYLIQKIASVSSLNISSVSLFYEHTELDMTCFDVSQPTKNFTF